MSKLVLEIKAIFGVGNVDEDWGQGSFLLDPPGILSSAHLFLPPVFKKVSGQITQGTFVPLFHAGPWEAPVQGPSSEGYFFLTYNILIFVQ